MMAIFLFAFVFPVMTGLITICLAWPDQRFNFENVLIKFSLAIGIGFGINSLCFIVWVFILGPKKGIIPSVISELALFLILFVITLLTAKKNTAPQIRDCYDPPNSIKRQPIYKILLISTCIISIMSMISFVSILLRYPHGGWDAWAIWNMHARFLFRGDLDWHHLFSSTLHWTANDHPFLIPGFIAQCWGLIGRETVLVPAMIAMLFTFGTVGVVISSLSLLKGRTEGFLAGIMLMGTSFFIEHGTSQYADVPLSFFFCSSLALLCIVDDSYVERRKLLPLIGLVAALSAWTKDEGILFIFSLMVARFIVIVRFKGFKAFAKEMGFLSIGIVPVTVIIVYFKLILAPPSNFFGGSIAPRLFDLHRYLIILAAYKNQFMNFGFSFIGIIPLLLVYLFMSGIDIKKKNIPLLLTPLITLSLMISVYFVVFLVSRPELNWMLSTCLNRLILQLWPSALIFVFLLAKPVEGEKSQS